MRIRLYKPQDADALLTIAQSAAEVDQTTPLDPDTFVAWLSNPEIEATANAFVMTDDDDELQTWGQAGTLEGIEGEVVGYTVLLFQQRNASYHFLCQGAVHPAYRRQHAGSVLLVGALNRARLLALEFEFEAEDAGLPIYFEVLLPVNDPATPRFAAKYELEPTSELAPPNLQCYRRTL